MLYCRVYCYFCVDLDDIQWNKVTTSATRNFNNSWPLYLIFLIIINLWFLKIPNVSDIFIWKRSRQKKQIFHIFNELLFRNGQPIDMNVSVFWETSVGFLKNVVLQLFPKYSQSNVNLNVKSRSNSTTFKKQASCFSVFHLDVTCRTL